MNRENRILTVSGLALIALTMFFGFWYAIFDEHQTLNAMGGSMAAAFVEAANSNMDQAYAALDRYGALAREYRQEIHFHGHLGFLGLTLVLLGLVAHTLNLGEGTRAGTALLLSASALVFPLGVFLQVLGLDGPGELLAALGSMGLVIGMLLVAIGFLRPLTAAG